jgi:hypothetical protein
LRLRIAGQNFSRKPSLQATISCNNCRQNAQPTREEEEKMLDMQIGTAMRDHHQPTWTIISPSLGLREAASSAPGLAGTDSRMAMPGARLTCPVPQQTEIQRRWINISHDSMTANGCWQLHVTSHGGST